MMIEKRMKVPGGKLLILKAELDGPRICKVHLEGDFFFHPEKKLELFEEAIPKIANEDKNMVSAKLQEISSRENMQLVGITTEAIAELVHQIVDETNRGGAS